MVGVAIIAFAIIAILGRVYSTRQASNISAETANIQTIISNSQQAYAAHPNFQELNNSLLASAGGFPTQMVVEGNVVSSWSKPVTVGPQTIPSSDTSKGQIDYSEARTSLCVALVGAVARNVDSIYVDGIPVKPSGESLVTASQVDTACQSSSGKPTVSVVFTK
jgi:type II secretory pathway pseudopilin PulG